MFQLSSISSYLVTAFYLDVIFEFFYYAGSLWYLSLPFLVVLCFLIFVRKFFKANNKWLPALFFVLFFIITSLVFLYFLQQQSSGVYNQWTVLILIKSYFLPILYVSPIWLVVELIKNKKSIKKLSNTERLSIVKRFFLYDLMLIFILVFLNLLLVFFLEKLTSAPSVVPSVFVLLTPLLIIFGAIFRLAKISLLIIFLWMIIEYRESKRLIVNK